MTDLVWNVVYHDINTDKIKVYNIFKHGSFVNKSLFDSTPKPLE